MGSNVCGSFQLCILGNIRILAEQINRKCVSGYDVIFVAGYAYILQVNVFVLCRSVVINNNYLHLQAYMCIVQFVRLQIRSSAFGRPFNAIPQRQLGLFK